jgi:hypothetical protein
MCEHIHDRQRTKTPSVQQLISHEIDTLRLIRPRCLEPFFSMSYRFPLPLWAHLLQRQPFFLIQPQTRYLPTFQPSRFNSARILQYP